MCAPRSPSAPEPDRAVEPPDLGEGRVEDPVLQVRGAEVVDLAELAGLDHLAREPHGRDEAVVERAHVLDARRGDAAVHLEDSSAVRPSGFSQTTCLPASAAAMVGSAWNEFGPEVVEELAVGRRGRASRSSSARSRTAAPRRLRPPSARRSRRAVGAAARPCHVGEGAVGVRVRLPHEGVAEHADADRVRQVGDAAGDGLGHVGLEAAHETSALNC